MPTITLAGLGPGASDMLTPAVSTLLQTADIIWTTAAQHPVLQHLPSDKLRTLPAQHVQQSATLLCEQAKQNDHILCALPGHPCDTELFAALQTVCTENADDQHVDVRIVPGLSLIESFCAAFAISRSRAGLQVFAASSLTTPPARASDDKAWCEVQGIASYTPPLLPYPITPTQPLLIWWVASPYQEQEQDTAQQQACIEHIQQLLRCTYPPHHPLELVRLNRAGEMVRQCSRLLRNLEPEVLQPGEEHLALLVAPLTPDANRRSFDGLAWVVMRLLAPEGCPWDREQTFQTLRAGLLEETYEVLEALDSNDMAHLSEELGDLLLQVVVQSEMARQAGSFAIGDVLQQINSKLIRRHPHVFGELAVSGTGEVLHNWEHIKAQELQEKGRQRSSALDGIPAGLPALAASQRVVAKAIKAGFTWDDVAGVWNKMHEELHELQQACMQHESHPSEGTLAHMAEELGDILFVLTILAHWFKLDAESSLREATSKFRQRFTTMEQLLQQRGETLHTLSMEEKLARWTEAKQRVG